MRYHAESAAQLHPVRCPEAKRPGHHKGSFRPPCKAWCDLERPTSPLPLPSFPPYPAQTSCICRPGYPCPSGTLGLAPLLMRPVLCTADMVDPISGEKLKAKDIIPMKSVRPAKLAALPSGLFRLSCCRTHAHVHVLVLLDHPAVHTRPMQSHAHCTAKAAPSNAKQPPSLMPRIDTWGPRFVAVPWRNRGALATLLGVRPSRS